MTIIRVPDVGDSSNVTVIEVAVSSGDTVAQGDTLIVLESDKASMEIPADASGMIGIIHIAEGSKVNEGDPICELDGAEIDGAEIDSVAEPSQANPAPIEPQSTDGPSSSVAETLPQVSSTQLIAVPDTGNADGTTVIEVAVSEGELVSEGDILVVLESDKASMEIPAMVAGKVLSLKVSEGSSVVEGDPICELEVHGDLVEHSVELQMDEVSSTSTLATVSPMTVQTITETAKAPVSGTESIVHAGPAVRATAREFGVVLNDVPSTGPRGRITKDDLHAYVKDRLSGAHQPTNIGTTGIPPIPATNFESFGSVERIPMTKIQKVTADNMIRCWLNVPAVTQFDEADITDLEAFRNSMKSEAEKRKVRLTPLPFLIKAAAHALVEMPQVNASIDPSTSEIVLRKYIHIGIAVDTPNGLMVPVIRDANYKSLWDLTSEVADLANKAKNKKLKPQEMHGATFTISSLGSIGGTAFTPIVPSPQAAILGVSKASMQPKWDGSQFQPRFMLPLCLSYDHRVINGGDGARFTAILGRVLGDIRHLLL